MQYSDIIKLVLMEGGRDSRGGIAETEKRVTEVFADCSSIKRTEFYAAQTAGITPEIVFTIRAVDYDGEQRVRYNPKGETEPEAEQVYDIIRTYKKTLDSLELTCKRGVR